MQSLCPRRFFDPVAYPEVNRMIIPAFREPILKPRTERRNWTELNRHGLVFDELTNGLWASRASSLVIG